ncbi:hypothetical protein CEB3_c30530 [Peptococcaceae bacterium CEB3]|nr:hypothetical protein CEB3_c30530 [Peptococcaceae bacterium CEB3]
MKLFVIGKCKLQYGATRRYPGQKSNGRTAIDKRKGELP